jgi:S-DNA-T family DNA segregation ATPase FtsK/SpoIIIE
LDPHVRLWLADGKGVDLLDYEDIAEQFMARPDPAALVALLTEAIEEMEDRYAVMGRHRAKKITAEVAAELGIHPLLLHIDELAFFTRSKLGDEIVELLRDFVSRGRAALMMLSAATQRPSRDVVHPDLRDLMSIRMAMRCTTPESSDMTLGRGWAGQGFSAATFDPSQRGAALLLSEGSAPVRMRTGMLSDNQVTALAKRAYRLREAAGTLPKSDARPAVRLLKMVLGGFGDADRVATADLLAYLSGDLVYSAWDASALADALRPLGVRPGDQWIGGQNLRGYRRVDVMRALDRA